MAADLKDLFTNGWSIDRSSTVPAYVQIEDRIVDLVESGRLRVGARIAPERDLARWVGVSRMTARAALAGLADRGLLERDVGRGTFVARAKLAHDLSRFGGFTDMARRQGLAATARIRAINEQPMPQHVAAELQRDPGAPAYRIERIRLAGNEPLVLEDSWIPTDRFPGLLDYDVRGSLYELMRDVYDLEPVRAVERLEPTVADEAQAVALGIAPGAPVMLVERVAYTLDDTPVEFARDRHRGDRARFVVTVGVPAGAATPTA